MARLPEITAVRRRDSGISRVARIFFLLASVSLLSAMGITWLLAAFLGRPEAGEEMLFPSAFAVSSLLLAAGSFSLSQAWRAVRREKQKRFRRWLLTALLLGTLFVGIQSYGLYAMFPAERSPDAPLETTAFVLTAVTLHGVHFLVAVLFVAFVLARAGADRYDHEYYWGVTVCAWFWHALGIIWLAILGVFAIVI
jgi:cytochrome c oxidase subunit III